MTRTPVTIETADGAVDSHFFTPADGARGPAILFYMDGLGIRPDLFTMGERLAAHGYTVLLPNLYYRYGPAKPLDFATDRDTIMAMVASVTNAAVTRDTVAFLAFLDAQPAVIGPRIGTVGYCMGGALSLTAAEAFPDRVAASVSMHGARLATDAPDSPHLSLGKIKGRVYVGVSEIDPWLEPGETERLEAALTAAGTDHRVEIYAGVHHGFAPPGMAIYDRDASERHWERLFELFGATLKGE